MSKGYNQRNVVRGSLGPDATEISNFLPMMMMWLVIMISWWRWSSSCRLLALFSHVWFGILLRIEVWSRRNDNNCDGNSFSNSESEIQIPFRIPVGYFNRVQVYLNMRNEIQCTCCYVMLRYLLLAKPLPRRSGNQCKEIFHNVCFWFRVEFQINQKNEDEIVQLPKVPKETVPTSSKEIKI